MADKTQFSDAVAAGQGRGASFPAAALVARRDEPLQSDATDLSNVVPFTRPRRHGAAQEFPLPSVAADERPAPLPPEHGVVGRLALLAGSIDVAM